MKIHNDDRRELDATFSVEDDGTIVFESRGGTKGSLEARNIDYNAGLELLLCRLAHLGATLLDVVVDSTVTRALPVEHRRVVVEEMSYPINLGGKNDFIGLRRALGRAQAQTGRAPGAIGGGNSTKRLRLTIGLPQPIAPRVLERRMAMPSKQPPAELVLEDEVHEAQAEGAFDPRDAEDARRRQLRTIAIRQGQPTFRRELLRAYRRRCTISGCDAEDALEAAHIQPYRGNQTNHVQNGLLLRADLHVLFDRGLIAIDVETWKVVVHERLVGTDYGRLEGVTLSLPDQEADCPSVEALRHHREDAEL